MKFNLVQRNVGHISCASEIRVGNSGEMVNPFMQGEVVSVNAVKAYVVSRGIAPLIINVDTR